MVLWLRILVRGQDILFFFFGVTTKIKLTFLIDAR